MTRDELHGTFNRLFSTPSMTRELKAIRVDELAQVEAGLSTIFPVSYVAFATKYGAIWTPSILDLVTGGDSGIAPEGVSFDVQSFWSADEIIASSKRYWSAGMESNLVGIASDCMGNVFGFRRQQIAG